MIDDPKPYRKISRPVEAMRIIDYVSMKKAENWVVSSGGFAEVRNMLKSGEEKLFVETSLGLINIPKQYYLIKGDLGGFYSYPAEIFEQEYELVEVNHA